MPKKPTYEELEQRIRELEKVESEHKRAEEELRVSDEKYRNLAENPFVGIYRTALHDGTFLYSNQKNAEIVGYNSAQELIGRLRAADFYPSEDREELLNILRKEGKVEDFETELVLKDGTKKNISISGQLWTDKGYLEGVIVDITERKRAEEEREKLQAQLAQAQKMESVGRLAGGVAHDFNNMLGVILGRMDMILDRVGLDQSIYADLQEIQTAAQRSADITRQLLGFARKQTITPKVLDFNETVGGMLRMLRRLIGEGIDLTWRPGRDLVPVRIDPSQIDQILVNLCINARDAIAGTGKLIIETDNAAFDEDYCAHHTDFVPGDYVLLAVSDNGCGMDQQTLCHLFEPFFTTKKLDKGTGLGLATVYGIVKQNSGFINVYSEPGHGATFKIYLPRYWANGKTSPETEKDHLAERGYETILLVEDEPAILSMTKQMLENLGYHVMSARKPGEAIHLAQEYAGEIHLVLTDVVMPEMNGLDLSKNLMALYPGIKRLFMSGYTANVIAHHSVLDESVNFIQKPFSMNDLGSKVREALDEGKI